MPDVQTTLEYLQRLPLYDEEKPYWCFLPPHEGFDPDKQRVDNLEWENHSGITITDIRKNKGHYRLDDNGFQVMNHDSKFTKFENLSDIDNYKLETENLLKETMNAVYVKCYDTRLRKNILFRRTEFDLNDPLTSEGPARGAHNDITYNSGPVVINRYSSDEAKAQYLQPGYRIRIVNTWRTLVPDLEDRPLALCDSRSVDPNKDLTAADRIIPDRVGEVYYLHYNANQRWYWLEKQMPSEPYIFTMYDTKAGPHARFCPHVSFNNPRSPPGATPRESIETRSIVITKDPL